MSWLCPIPDTCVLELECDLCDPPHMLHITKQFSESIMRKNNQTTLDSEKAQTEMRKR